MNRSLLVTLVIIILANSTVVAQQAAPTRETQVRERGHEVMPFDLARTQHQFEKTDTGGLQRVVARDGSRDQVASIRQHLRQIAESFAARDFGAPTKIHGDDMPGLAQLRAAKEGELDVAYREIDGGAEIAYRGHTPAIRAAIHRWFDAQLSDHGHDATDHHHHGS